VAGLSRLLWPIGSDPGRPPLPRAHARPSNDDEARVVATLESAIAEHRARRWAVAEPLLRWVIQNPSTSADDRHAARNILGNLLERVGRPEEAAEVYEANLAEDFSGRYPYERLAVIYRRQRRAEDELRVLRQAVAVVERELARGRRSVVPQLERLQALLADALARYGLSAPDEPRG
jgi:hypothetical protein